MKLLKLLFVLPLFSCVTLFSQTQIFDWAKACSGNNNEQGNSIAIDANGNQYITGSFEGTVDFDPGNGVQNKTSTGECAFVLKLDAQGNFAWVKTFESRSANTNWSTGTAIAIKNNDLIIGGNFAYTVDFDPSSSIYNITPLVSASPWAHDAFIVKMDLAGNFIWARAIGNTDNEDPIKSISINSADNIIIMGGFYQAFYLRSNTNSTTINIPVYVTPDYGSYIMNLDANGNQIWTKLFAPDSDFIGGATVDGNDNVIAVFADHGGFDANPGSGAYMLIYPNWAMSVIKLDVNGNFLWAKSIGDNVFSARVAGTFIISDTTTNDILICGRFGESGEIVDFDPGAGVSNLQINQNGSNPFILKLDPNGNYDWAKCFGYSQDNNRKLINEATSFDIDAAGNVYVTGKFSGTKVDFNPDTTTTYLLDANNADYDIFILKVNSQGSFVWAKAMGGTSDDHGYSIALDANQNIYTTGYFKEAGDFNTESGAFYLSSLNSTQDIFIHKLRNNSSTGVDDVHQNNAIVVYPNPASSVIKINTKTETPKNILVYDMLGKLVLNEKPTAALHTLHIQELTKGIYFLQLEFEQKTETIKIVKQ